LMGDVNYIAVKPLPNISPEQACDARARAWAYVFECLQARKGDLHDLTNSWTTEIANNEPRKTEREKT
jgi:hypothetical protein